MAAGKSYIVLGTLGDSGSGSQPNLLVNGEFRINQRGYVSAAALASGAYGLDRWASSTASSSMTFTLGAQSTVCTINSGGSFKQTVERANVQPGVYTLAWAGTATARIYNVGATAPSYAASPITVTLDGTADVAVEITAVGATKTVSAVQLVKGSRVGAIEHLATIDELRRAQRYLVPFAVGDISLFNPYFAVALGGGNQLIPRPLTVPMRTTPTFTDAASGAALSLFTYYSDVAGTNLNRLVQLSATSPTTLSAFYSSTNNSSTTLAIGYPTATNASALFASAEF